MNHLRQADWCHLLVWGFGVLILSFSWTWAMAQESVELSTEDLEVIANLDILENWDFLNADDELAAYLVLEGAQDEN